MEFLNPNKVLKQLRLQRNFLAVDLGSGSGGWVIPLAQKLDEGDVWAVDILETALSGLRAKAELSKIENIKTLLADVEKGVKLLDNYFDLVLITNLLFEVENKRRVLEEAKRILKTGGQILIVDWKNESPFGPRGGRVSQKEIKELAKELKLKPKKEFDASPYHYGLILLK